jgi:hypothetical protein
MNPAHVFAMQTTRAQSFGAPGGAPTITQGDAALYCKGMPRRWYLAGRLRWGLDLSVAEELERELWIAAVDLKIKERWRIPKSLTGKHPLRNMAKLAIVETIEPSRFKYDDSWKLRAAMVGVDNKPWHTTWSRRYERVYGELNDWANDGWRHVERIGVDTVGEFC